MTSKEEAGSREDRTSSVRAWLAFVLWLAALAVAAAVQWEVGYPAYDQTLPLWWGGAALLGAVAWLFSTRSAADTGDPPDLDATEPAVTSRRGWSPLLATLLAISASLVLLYRDLTSPAGTALWALSVLALPAAVAWREGRNPSRVSMSTNARLWHLAAAALVVASLGLRLYQLEAIPAKYLDDEGAVADWGLNYLHGTPFFGQHMAADTTLFRNGTTAYPLVGSYIHALVMQVAGETIFGSRLTAAVAGAVCVGVLYLLLLAHVPRWIAFAGAFLLAVCHTHLFWSRSGIPQSMTVTAITAVMALTLAGLRSGRWSTFAWAGLILGLSQYFYEGARFFAAVLAAFLLLRLLLERGFLRRRVPQVLAMIGVAALVFAPIGLWYLQNPYEFVARSRGVLIFAQPDYLASRYPGLDTTGVILAQLRRALEGFAFRGDGANFYSLRGPIVDPVTRVLLLGGVLGTIALRPRLRLLTALWIWIPIAIVCVPTVDPPSMTRLVQVVPPLFIVAALVLDRLQRVARRAAGVAGSGFVVVAAAAALVYAAQWNLSQFFVRYPRDYGSDPQTVGAVVSHRYGLDYKTFILGGPYSNWSPAVRFVNRGFAAETLEAGIVPIPERGWRNGFVVVRTSDTDTLTRMRASYPDAVEAQARNSRDEPAFVSFEIPAATLNRQAPADAPWKTADARFGRRGTRRGEFASPRALAVDARGFLYVADAGNRRISVFDAAGNFAFDFGRAEAPPSADSLANGSPLGLALLDDGSLLVLSRDPWSLKRYSAAGEFLGDIQIEARFDAPVGIAAAPGGFYLLDSSNISLLGLDGKVRARVGEKGSGPGQFTNADAIAVTPDGDVFVHDQGNSRVQRFTRDLSYLGEWPLSLPEERLGQNLAASAADPQHVYVAAPTVGAERFALDGKRSWPVGQRGDFPGMLSWPLAITVDKSGNVYLYDENRGQIFRYDLSRNLALTRQN